MSSVTLPVVTGGGAVTLRWRVSGRAGVDEDDFLAGVELFDLVDLGAGLAGGAAGLVVVRAEFGVAGGGVADEDPGDWKAPPFPDCGNCVF